MNRMRILESNIFQFLFPQVFAAHSLLITTIVQNLYQHIVQNCCMVTIMKKKINLMYFNAFTQCSASFPTLRESMPFQSVLCINYCGANVHNDGAQKGMRKSRSFLSTRHAQCQTAKQSKPKAFLLFVCSASLCWRVGEERVKFEQRPSQSLFCEEAWLILAHNVIKLSGKLLEVAFALPNLMWTG